MERMPPFHEFKVQNCNFRLKMMILVIHDIPYQPNWYLLYIKFKESKLFPRTSFTFQELFKYFMPNLLIQELFKNCTNPVCISTNRPCGGCMASARALGNLHMSVQINAHLKSPQTNFENVQKLPTGSCRWAQICADLHGFPKALVVDDSAKIN